MQVLWNMVILNIEGYGEKEAKIAMYILGICGKYDTRTS